MDEILREIVDFVIGSIPTMVIFLILLPCYTYLVHKPVRRVLAERRERTAGAVEKAHAAMAMAEAKTQEYEARLRAARVEGQKAREKQVAAWNAARDQALEQAREAAGVRVRTARAAVEAEATDVRARMEQPGAAIDGLATEILEQVLPGGRVDTEGVRA
jgi:F-type H+-transporting ATPase subunit b